MKIEAEIKECREDEGIDNSKVLDTGTKKQNDSRSSNRGTNQTKIWICDECEETFLKLSDLELHLKSKHGQTPTFSCDECNSKFVTKTRLVMHLQIHLDRNIKTCHYFNNEKICPFIELGCKFLHITAVKCKYDKFCTLHSSTVHILCQIFRNISHILCL